MKQTKFAIIRGDLSGLATLTYKESSSPLRVGELATDLPFKAFEGVNPKMLQMATVSNEKLDGIIRRQTSFAKQKRMTVYSKLKVYDVKQPQQFNQSVVTLVKHVDNNTFETKLTDKVILFVTGKKSTWTSKGVVLPVLTQEELIVCTLAEFALDKFHTLNGIELKCSFYQSGEITWRSKY